MARLQILELPEGADDERPPFVLVVDQVDGDAVEAIANAGLTTAELIGARAVLAFEETIEIPANDTTAYLDAAVSGALPAGARSEMTIGGKSVTWTHVDETRARAVAAVRERTDIARDMDRLAKWKNELLDALGMDRTRDWDDIRNAAAGVRKERDAQAQVIERVRKTAGQWRLAATEGDLGVAWSEAATAVLALLDNPNITYADLGFNCPAITGHAAVSPAQPDA